MYQNNQTGNISQYKRNIQVRWGNHCRLGKLIRITCSESVFVTTVIQHTKRMRRIISQSLVPLYSIFPRYFINGKILEKSY
jgi:hypothetical protein